MKQSIKKILALTMALTVLVSSHSFAYFEHLCTLTQKKTLSFHLKDCSGEELTPNQSKSTSLKKGSCCHIDLKVNKAKTAVQQSYNLAFSPFIAEEISIPQFKFKFKETLLSEIAELNFGDSSPPTLVPIFILNQQFII